MASFEVKIYPIEIEEHPNADAIELAKVGEYRSIVRKGQFKSGDLVAYIPEAAVVPDWLLQEIGLEGKLAGKQKNRVKAIKLRGVLSQGIVYQTEMVSPLSSPVVRIFSREGGELRWKDIMEGDDVTEFLGITKYEPPIPTAMAGEVYNAGEEWTVKYDIENWKKFPDIIEEGEPVVFTEKLHGTFMMFGIMTPEGFHDEHYHNRYGDEMLVASKGLGGRGLCFKHNEANKNNVYLRAATQNDLFGMEWEDILRYYGGPLFILGEVYGSGVQDLQYGCDQGEIKFRVFDVCTGKRGDQHYFDDQQLEDFCDYYGLERVPVLYRGPFSKEVLLQYTSGKETVSGTEACIREGIVMRPTIERYHDDIGRVQLKNVSDEYLTRKGGTENQ